MRSNMSKASVLSPLTPRLGRQLRTSDSARSVDRTDALWAEMQATLEEVEVSASGGTHVFGPDHDRKLAQLRIAQIALAQAWARSEADDAIETKDGGNAGPAGGGTAAGSNAGGTGGIGVGGDEVRALKGTMIAEAGKSVGDGTEAKSTAGSTSVPRPGSSGGVGAERLGVKLEDETRADILLARKRRDANDLYFQRVNRGVLDVVAKLEDVATVMREVEQESKDVWGPDSPPESTKS